MNLPTVKGSNLARQKMTFPQDFVGEINLVFIAFKRWHQDVIEEWVPFVEQLAQQNPSLYYYEFPTLPSKGVLYRTFLNEGMRAGIPSKATRERTITLYLNKPDFRKALDIDHEQDMWIYLFDQSGQVLWRTIGRFTEEKAKTLSDIVRERVTE